MLMYMYGVCLLVHPKSSLLSPGTIHSFLIKQKKSEESALILLQTHHVMNFQPFPQHFGKNEIP